MDLSAHHLQFEVDKVYSTTRTTQKVEEFFGQVFVWLKKQQKIKLISQRSGIFFELYNETH